jgi:hypothetical protein
VIRDPESGETLARLLMAAAESTAGAAETWQNILADLHEKQRAFVLDTASRKCALKGRRGGGSYAIAAWLLEEWHLWPGAMSLYIALSKDHAKSILWPTLIELDEKYQLGATFNGQELTATLPNGYVVRMCGAKDKIQIEKLRGFAKGARRVGIDECGSFQAHDANFRYLINSVLSPQLMDTHHKGGGQIALISSPGLAPMGVFFEKTTGRDHMGKPVRPWKTHHWTALDNPYVGAQSYLVEELEEGGHILDGTPAAQIVAELLELKDTPLSDPAWIPLLARLSVSFRREYLAEWVKDKAALVYNAEPHHLLPPGWKLPRGVYRIVIGCDPGWSDGNGFAVAAKPLEAPDIYLLRAYYRPEMSTADIADELKMLSAEYHTGEIYADTGGEGDRLLADFDHCGILVQRAQKGLKKPRIEYTRSLLDRRRLWISADCVDLVQEWQALPWDEHRQSHRDGFYDDVADAGLMAIWPLSQRFVEPHSPPPALGTPEWRALEAKREHELSVRMGKRIRRPRKRLLR